MSDVKYTTEASKARHLVTQYCIGAGLDLASHGEPIVPHAWQLELPPDDYARYNCGQSPLGPIQLRGDARKLPVDTASLGFVFCSHLLEDFPEEEWPAIFTEWSRVVIPGGYLIILIPDRALWLSALVRGQPPNDAHRREGEVGLMSKYAIQVGLTVIEDRLTQAYEGDYTIMGVFQKPK